VRWIDRIKKRLAIRGYVHRLGLLLVRRYGFQEAYSPGRITSTIAKHRLSLHYVEYACAMYATRERFAAWMRERSRATARGIPARAVAEAPTPYRSRLQRAPARAAPEADFATLFTALRAEVSARHGIVGRSFVPRVERNFERYSNGDNPGAAARWGFGL